MNSNLTLEQRKILNHLESSLRSNKIRLTKGRREILRIILLANHPTFNEIIKSLEKITNEKPNTMSVYNTINMLLANDVIYANTFDGRQISYEVKIPQSGHFKCHRCLKVTHLEKLNEIDTILKKLALKHKWSYEYFKLELHGLCGKCDLDFAE